jgi:hypothetical protein
LLGEEGWRLMTATLDDTATVPNETGLLMRQLSVNIPVDFALALTTRPVGCC